MASSFDEQWYPFFVLKFRRDTYHLSTAARGIYRELIDEYMMTGRPLPDHDSALATIARATADEWAAHRDVVRSFFKAKDGKLYQKRCEQELHAQRMLAAKRSQKAKEAATLRWAKEKRNQQDECYEHAHSNAGAMPNDATNKHINKLTTASVVEGQKASERIVASPELVSLVQKRR